jgi:hypothetical protein
MKEATRPRSKSGPGSATGAGEDAREIQGQRLDSTTPAIAIDSERAVRRVRYWWTTSDPPKRMTRVDCWISWSWSPGPLAISRIHEGRVSRAVKAAPSPTTPRTT